MKKRIISILTTIALVVTMLTTLIIPASALDDSVQAPETASSYCLSNIIDLKDSVVYGDPETATTGYIFYPGGNVSYKDYGPLLMAIAQKGYLVISVRMPLNFAILNIPAATIFTNRYKNIDTWYIGGHSLGGAMSAVYAGLHARQLEGLILFAAYSTSDLSNKDLDVLSIYGSNDGVLNMEKYESNKANLPSTAVEVVIEGGNHCQFGDYGFQDGDNEATISAAEQVAIAADAVGAFLAK